MADSRRTALLLLLVSLWLVVPSLSLNIAYRYPELPISISSVRLNNFQGHFCIVFEDGNLTIVLSD